MSPKATGASAGSVPVRPQPDTAYPLTRPIQRELCNSRTIPSLEAKRELLDSAFIHAVRALGVPLDMAAVQTFNDYVDATYRQLLVARRPARPHDFDYRLRAALIEHRAVEL